MKRLAPAIFLFLSSIMLSQETASEATEDMISNFYSIPDIPALDFLSSDPDNISKPSTTRELVTSLYNALDEDGKVKQGLALEIKPSYLLNIPVNLQDYQDDEFKYMLYNTQVSVASLASSGDIANTDLSWGVRMVIFDNSDPMSDRDFTNMIAKQFVEGGPDSPESSDEEEELKEMAKIIKEGKKEFVKNHWNASWLAVSYAGGTRLKGSEITEGNSIGHQFLVAGGFRISTFGQLGYQAKWSEELREETEMYFEEFELSSRLTIKGKSTLNFFAEIGYNPLLNKEDFESFEEINTERDLSWLGGFEFLITKDLWLNAGVGSEADRFVEGNGIQVLSGIKFGIADKQRIQAPTR